MFTREQLNKENKELLIARVMKMEEENLRLSELLHSKEKEEARSRFEDYMYNDYIEIAENLRKEKQYNEQNSRTIQELEMVLEKYKNIVDKLGGAV